MYKILPIKAKKLPVIGASQTKSLLSIYISFYNYYINDQFCPLAIYLYVLAQNLHHCLVLIGAGNWENNLITQKLKEESWDKIGLNEARQMV